MVLCIEILQKGSWTFSSIRSYPGRFASTRKRRWSFVRSECMKVTRPMELKLFWWNMVPRLH